MEQWLHQYWGESLSWGFFVGSTSLYSIQIQTSQLIRHLFHVFRIMHDNVGCFCLGICSNRQRKRPRDLIPMIYHVLMTPTMNSLWSLPRVMKTLGSIDLKTETSPFSHAVLLNEVCSMSLVTFWIYRGHSRIKQKQFVDGTRRWSKAVYPLVRQRYFAIFLVLVLFWQTFHLLDADIYPSTFHSTPGRRKFSKDEWERFTKDSTEKALEGLVSSPDFSKWLVDNADRISITPQSSRAEKHRKWPQWFWSVKVDCNAVRLRVKTCCLNTYHDFSGKL